MTNQIKYTKELLVLTWPIMFGFIGHMLIGAGDVFVAGRHSAEVLAAIAIANTMFILVYALCIGLMISISPVLSKERGEGRNINEHIWTCLLYGTLISVGSFFLLRFSISFVPLIGVEKALVPMIRERKIFCVN